MKVLRIFLMAALVLSFSTGAFAFNFFFDPLNGVSSSPFDYNQNWAPITFPGNPPHLPSPGLSGGEVYDFEGFFTAWDADFLYIAIANSSGYSAGPMNLGDVFFGFGRENYQYAIDVNGPGASNELFDVSGGRWTGIPNEPGTWGGVASVVDAVGAFEMTGDADYVGMVEHAYTMWPDLEPDPIAPVTNGDVHVLEWKIDRTLLTLLGGGTGNEYFHVTIRCGNDFADIPGIPEPTTMLLVGAGLLGVGLIRRKK